MIRLNLLLLILGTSQEVLAAVPAHYTVLVYMVGSDLESGKGKPAGHGGEGSKSLAQMMSIGSDDKLNIVVQTGGAQKWFNKSINPQSVQRWLVKKGALSLQGNLGSVSMSTPKTLQDFVAWGVKAFPAKKYMLVLWDHGGGSVGPTFGLDDFSGNMLSLKEIKAALQGAYNATKQKFEVVAFEACLMANLETAYTLSNFANYMVASEEISYGWNYLPILNAIKANPAIDGLSLGKAIAQGMRAITTMWPKLALVETLSVIDLAKVPLVVSALNDLSKSASYDLYYKGQPSFIALANGRSHAETFGIDEVNQRYSDMVDLKDTAQNLTKSYPAQAKAVINAVDQAVKYNIRGKSKPNANGISIFMPERNLNQPILKNMIFDYRNMEFSEPYKDFVARFAYAAWKDQTKPVFSDERQQNNSLTAKIESDDIDSLHAYISTDTKANQDIVYFGYDTVEDLNGGYIRKIWDGKSYALNNHFVYLIVSNEEQGVTQFSIPAYLNQERTNIFVEREGSHGAFRIIGAWPGFDGQAAQREIDVIRPGDIIAPLFQRYSRSKKSYEWYSSKAFTVPNSGLVLHRAPLPAGKYKMGFVARDYAQNQQLSTAGSFESPVR